MFKIESYITPLLMGYVNKYVELRQEDFQLSLWGGDAVLNNLDLRLHVLEKAIQLPIVFKSGHIHELRIHVPWTKLGSEPVVITINTIECILKVRATAYDDGSSSVSADSTKKMSQQIRAKAKLKRPEECDLPPGYLQSLMNRILNNVSVIINNLILKFVEDDIVLSLNIKSAECYSVDIGWNRAFIDLVPPELVLRKVINICDLTVCLDKTDASGKIENYQEPLLYRCSVSCRLFMAYDSINAKIPKTTQFNVACDQLELSLSDCQLPMFLRLVELCVALYYGTRLFEEEDETKEPDKQEVDRVSLTDMDQGDGDGDDNNDEDSQGWASWAWSYVPQILPSEEDLLDEEDRPKNKALPQVLSIGFYIHKASVMFKLTERMKQTPSQLGSQRAVFQPFLFLESQGLSAEILLHGIEFFDAQCGITELRISTAGNCICGIVDVTDSRSQVLLQAGESLDNKTKMNFLSLSLFDPNSAENLGNIKEYILEEECHLATYTEQYGLQRYGAFWMDYNYVMHIPEKSHSGSKSSTTGDHSDVLFFHENAIIRFLVGHCQLNVTSAFYHRVQKVLYCAWDHQYQPYGTTKIYPDDKERTQLTEEEIHSLEEFIPTHTYQLTLVEPVITIHAAEHAQCDVKRKSYKASKKKSDSKTQKTNRYVLPACQISATRCELQVVSPMYPGRVVRLVSTVAGLSNNLLYYCNSHTQIKIFGLLAGLLKVEPNAARSTLLTVVPPSSGVFCFTKLLLPKYWKSSYLPLRDEMFEVSQLSVNMSKASILLAMKIISSWLQKTPRPSSLSEDSLLQDVFPEIDRDTILEPHIQQMPMLEVVISGVQFKMCSTVVVTSYTGNLSSLEVMFYSKDLVQPLISGPADTSHLHIPDSFKQDLSQQELSADLFSFTIQLPKNTHVLEAPALILLNAEGLVINLDPLVLDWFSYEPHIQHCVKNEERPFTVDLALAQASSPLQGNVSQLSVHSSSSLTNPTGSQPLGQSQTTSQVISTRDSDTADQSATQDFGRVMADWFPLLRTLHVQVKIKSCCLFLPESTPHVSEQTMNIPANFSSAFQDRCCPSTLVICLPSINILSTGAKDIPLVHDIPITTIGESLIGEKLPWTFELHNFAVYTVLLTGQCWSVLKSLDITSTLAVTCKYNPPTSDNITSLGLCLHVDTQQPSVAVSKQQFQLGTVLANQLFDFITQTEKLSSHIHRCVQVSTNIQKEKQTITSSPVKKSETITSSNNEMTAEVSEDTSQDDTLSVDISDIASSQKIKLSLWTQLLMPKIEMKFFGDDFVSSKKNCITVTSEDIAISVDIQTVYSKVKASVGTFNIHHYIKSDSMSEWKKGDCEGLVISCQSDLSRDLHIISNKVWSSDNQPVISLHPVQDPQRDSTNGFLSFTFTKALCKNVKKRLRKLNVDLTDLSEIESEANFNDLYTHKYVSEVCLKMDPFDFVFCPSVLETLIDIFQSGTHTKGQSLPHPSTQAIPYKTLHKKKKQSMPVLAAHALPLVYATIGCIRIFVPETCPSRTPNYEDEKKVGNRKKTADGSDDQPVKIQTTLDHDMLVLQFHTILIQPHADNPLPRYPVEKELYHRSLLCGMTLQPGSAVEDRQYQVDIKGFSFCSGNWKVLVEESERLGKYKPAATFGVQMPALEWNTLLSLRDEEYEEIQLIPIISGCDLCIVMAPAIVYMKKGPSHFVTENVLVCGYSTEINITSDLDLYISTSQIHLAEKLLKNSISSLSKSQQGLMGISHHSQRLGQSDPVGIDSGLGSDISSCTVDRHKKSLPSVSESLAFSDSDTRSNVMPFDILLTAGRISCTVYSHKDCKQIVCQETKTSGKDKKRKAHKSSIEVKYDNFSSILGSVTQTLDSDEDSRAEQYDTCSEFEFLDFQTDEEQKNKTLPVGAVCMKPFLYMYITQPHTIVSCHSDIQRFEMSCYDIIVKGLNEKQKIPVERNRLIPDCADFTSYWVETRAGQPHCKTGIPPCLCTLQLTDFLYNPPDMVLKIERPLMLNLSLNKMEQIHEFVQELSFGNKENLEKLNRKSKLTAEDKISISPPGFLSKLKRVEFVTDQVVVSMETGINEQLMGLTAFASSIRVETGLQQTQISSISSQFHIKDAVIKTVYNKTSRSFIGPTSLSLELLTKWEEHSGPINIPMTVAILETTMIPINIGQEHVLCIQKLVEQCRDFAAPLRKCDDDTGKKACEEKLNVCDEEFVFVKDVSHDDLRNGGFQYLVGHDSTVRCDAGEIVFNTYPEGCGYGHAMTWCYKQPRVISSATIMPVPFGYVDLADRPQAIPCMLQYWDCSQQQFVDYVEFSLSENDSTSLDLPEVKPSNCEELIVAQSWRVAIFSYEVIQEDLIQNKEEFSEGEDNETYVVPVSLAACMCVDSCYVPCIIPVIQASVSIAAVQLNLSNHLHYLGKGTPSKLYPFYFHQSQPDDQQFATLTITFLNLTTSHLSGYLSRSLIKGYGSLKFEMTEYRNLTVETILDTISVEASVNVLHVEKPPLIDADVNVGSAEICVGQSTVHTLSCAVQAWTVLGEEGLCKKSQVIFSYFVICNDTQQTVRFGQFGTDENLTLHSREMHGYSWRSHKSEQLIHLCLDSPSWKWCEPFSIDKEENIVRRVKAKDQHYTLVIRVRNLSNIQKQIIISGQLIISNCLSQHMEIKLKKTGSGNSYKDISREDNSYECTVVGAGQTIPSYIVDEEELNGLMVRLMGAHMLWSQEVFVFGDKMKENRLLKIPLPGKTAYFHVWCQMFCEHFSGASQVLVVLSPLYVLRSHLPRSLFVSMYTPKLQATQKLNVPGRGREFQLHCLGGDITHNLTFQLALGLPESSPPVMLFTGLIDQIERNKQEKMDILEMCYTQHKDLSVSWPYSLQLANKESEISSISPVTKTVSSKEDVEQPSIDLSVQLTEYKPGCSTLLVDICPWCLLTNQSGIDLVVMTADKKQYCIPYGKTQAPPHFNDNLFYIGYYDGDTVMTSGPIPLSDELVSSKRYNNDIGRILFVDGYVHTVICLSEKETKAIFLTVCSEIQQGLRVITLRERFAITNLTPSLFETRLLALPVGSQKTTMSEQFIGNHYRNEEIPSHRHLSKSEENVKPLLFWKVVPVAKHPETEDDQRDIFVYHLSFKFKNSCHDTPEHLLWSLPLRLSANREGIRLTLSVPAIKNGLVHGQPYCITSSTDNGVTYLVVSKDRAPQCFVHNKCNFPVLFGQALMNISLSGTVIQEEAELVAELPTLPPGGSFPYTMPYFNSQFPAASVSMLPRMHFCTLVEKDEMITKSAWSAGVDITSSNDTFVKIPNVVDVKVSVKMVSMITHITITPIGKAEVSAREIRSRIEGAETKIMPFAKHDDALPLSMELEGSTNALLSLMNETETSRTSRPVISAGFFLKQLSIVLLNETGSEKKVSEILRFTSDQVFISLFPVTSSSQEEVGKSSLSVSVGDIQIDNQMYGHGQFDFPVLLLQQQQDKPRASSYDDMNLEDLSVTERHAVLRQSSFLHAQIVLAFGETTVTESIDIALKPLSLYIDDNFLYRLMREVKSFIPLKLSCDSNQPSRIKQLPLPIRITALSLSQPIRIHYLCIQPVSMLLSIHASVKMFLASDRTPLSFAKFERNSLCTTSHHLGHALAMHYLSGAIFRAGIVVGSLEILGNPTGLIRSIGTGVADMFRLPYAGLIRGPGAFISGISYGMGSLFKHISAGTITSVTNFASSVSRNMDRLSLDPDHLERQEENRRNRPVGISDGLKQGLSGFGLSLLGAVAGLADQPIKNVISNESETEHAVSRSRAATGLVTGMGKGLVGMVTKPIGGAAEFVSQTGQGILHGTGLGMLPERRQTPLTRSHSDNRNSVLKFSLKMLNSLPSTDLLLAVEATHLDLVGQEVQVVLLLSTEILFVINCEEDAQQQVFAVQELEIKVNPNTNNVITVTWPDQTHSKVREKENSSKDRITAFIDSTFTLAQPIKEDKHSTESQSETVNCDVNQITAPRYEFKLDPNVLCVFVSAFNFAKNRLVGRGFPV